MFSTGKKNESNTVGIILSYANTKMAINSVISCKLFPSSLRKKRSRPDFFLLASQLPRASPLPVQDSALSVLEKLSPGARLALTLPLGESKAPRVPFTDRLDPIHMAREA